MLWGNPFEGQIPSLHEVSFPHFLPQGQAPLWAAPSRSMLQAVPSLPEFTAATVQMLQTPMDQPVLKEPWGIKRSAVSPAPESTLGNSIPGRENSEQRYHLRI